MATLRESHSFLCKEAGGEIDPSMCRAKEDKEVESETPECWAFCFCFLLFVCVGATVQLPNKHTETYSYL